MAADTASSSVYPDFHHIPSSSSSAHSYPSRIPKPLLQLFSLFPLVVFPPAPSYESPPATETPTRPELYILPGHVRTDSSGSSTRTTWTSRDVRCLSTQMDFLLRGLDFQVRQVEREESWGPKSGHLPFVHLPAQTSSSKGRVSSISTGPPRLLAVDAIQTWAETVAPFPQERVETTGAPYEPYESLIVKSEAGLWKTLLEKGVMAAVLLAQLSSEIPTSATSSKPWFSSQLHSHLANQQLAKEGNEIYSLSSASTASTSLSRWSSLVPGMSFSWIGLGVNGMGGEDEGDEGSDGKGSTAGHVWPEGLDVDIVVAEGIQGIQAVAQRLSQQSQDAGRWFLQASHPTSLDALLFSQLHTILSLPACGLDSTVERLRQAVKDEEVLMKWTKGVYDDFVKVKEVECRKMEALAK